MLQDLLGITCQVTKLYSNAAVFSQMVVPIHVYIYIYIYMF